ncbi:MAG: TRAP transporter large permease subunit [Pseudomonadota bacterium]
MELFFLFLLLAIMAVALGSGYPVAFALPGAAIITIVLAAGTGYLLAGNTDAYFHTGGPTQWLTAGVTNLRGIYLEVERDTLIAIPLFIFMGIMLQRSKIAEDLLVAMAQLFGSVPGGLGISVVFVGALLAATTGIVGATVVAMGLISLPAMLRNNYSQSLATGTIAASGTLGQIIPPSIVLIILADQLASATDQASTLRKSLYTEATGELSMPTTFDVSSTSAGEMFLGALVPGLVLVGLYMTFILIFALLRPKLAPAVPYEGKRDSAFWGRILMTLVPPLALIFLVLGSIIGGIATVNQAGAIGAVGAMIMAGYRLREGEKGAFTPSILAAFALVSIGVLISFYDINIKAVNTSEDVMAVTLALMAVGLLLIALFWSGWRTLKIEDTLKGVMIDTAKTTSLVFIILLGAAMLTSAFRAFGGEELVKEFLQGLPGGFWAQFFIVMLVIFVLGFFLDFIEIAVVVVPIVAPILLADPSANVTAVWLGVMIGLNIQTSFLTPPFGFALFYLRGVAPAVVRTIDMYKGVIAFISLQLFALMIVGFYPQLVNYLPNRVSLLSETAPPPQNPRLQYCLEDYAYEQFQTNGATIDAAIDKAAGLDLSVLPEDLREDLAESFEKARASGGLIAAVVAAEEAAKAAEPGYRPVHRLVRGLERDARRYERRVEELELIVSRSGPNGIYTAEYGERAQARIDGYVAERDALLAQIPAEWEDQNKAYAELVKADIGARRTYRRNIDDAYEPLGEAMSVIRGAEALAAYEDEIRGLDAQISSLSPEEMVETVADLRSRINEVDGVSDIRRALNEIRKAMQGADPDPAAAREALSVAVPLFEQELAWRQAAQRDLLPALEAYNAAIADSVGIRGQEKLSREQALFVASCNAGHRDISLNF